MKCYTETTEHIKRTLISVFWKRNSQIHFSRHLLQQQLISSISVIPAYINERHHSKSWNIWFFVLTKALYQSIICCNTNECRFLLVSINSMIITQNRSLKVWINCRKVPPKDKIKYTHTWSTCNHQILHHKKPFPGMLPDVGSNLNLF